MSDSTASEAARALSRRRWGDARPIRLAHELARRADELPEAERTRLVAALQDHGQAEVEEARFLKALQEQAEVAR